MSGGRRFFFAGRAHLPYSMPMNGPTNAPRTPLAETEAPGFGADAATQKSSIVIRPSPNPEIHASALRARPRLDCRTIRNAANAAVYPLAINTTPGRTSTTKLARYTGITQFHHCDVAYVFDSCGNAMAQSAT